MLTDERHFYAYDELQVLIKACEASHQQLPIVDYGAGSRVNNNTNRSLRDITRSVKRPFWQYRWLFLLAQHLRPIHMLELGTSLGFSTLMLSRGARNSTLHTLEGAPALVLQAGQHFKWAEATNVQQVEGKFVDTLPQVLTAHSPFDLVLLDGHHTAEATVTYFEHILPHCSTKAILWIDDIYWSKGMTSAWQQLRQNDQVSISVDLFDFGLLFLRPGKAKEHFVLRR